MGTLNRNHYICEVTETTNNKMVMSRYFDGTQAEAVDHFLAEPSINKYIGRANHEVLMRGNSIDISGYKFDVWIEGWKGSAWICNAKFLGSFAAENFYDACKIATRKNKMPIKWLEVEEGEPVHCGQKLFDNEDDARKAHG